MKRNIFLYISSFGIIVTFDGLKYLLAGGPNLINWQSFIHPAWVISAIVILAANAYFWKPALFKLSFIVYFIIVAASLINQYLPFSEILTYNCMLFNLVFASIYFLLPITTND